MLLKNILFNTETPQEFLDPLKINKNLLDRIANESNPKKQLMLANKNLQLLGTGSGRYVFDIGEGKVIKLAPLRPEQNLREVEHWQCVKDTPAENMFVRVYYTTEDYKCLIAEKVVGFRDDATVLEFIFNSILNTANELPTTKKLLKNYFGSTLQDLWNRVVSTGEPPFKSKWYDTLKMAVNSCNIPVQKFLADNLGYRPSTGEFVILDFGY